VARRPPIFVLHRLPDPIEAALDRDFDVRRNPDDGPVPVERLVELARTVAAIVPTVTDPVPAAVFEVPGRRLELVANFGVGVNLIDQDAARRAGVIVTNTPGVLTDATADLTIGLLLMVLRRLAEGERLVRAGRWTGWRPTHLLGRDLRGLTLGIVGFGRIGQAVARRARLGFGMRILAAGHRPIAAETLRPVGALERPLDRLIEEADVVSLHCPLTPATTHLFDRARFARCRKGLVLLNTARGGLVDEAGLIEALENRTLGGAGLDVYAEEPAIPARLAGRDDVVLLPHLGSATLETRTAMGQLVVDNLRAHFRGEPPPNQVR
jgi:lactate dehydrogenase-like 2-hydroxyacid dehydrogenase